MHVHCVPPSQVTFLPSETFLVSLLPLTCGRSKMMHQF